MTFYGIYFSLYTKKIAQKYNIYNRQEEKATTALVYRLAYWTSNTETPSSISGCIRKELQNF
jgi:hypothetical protein